ncbi:MAG: flagellar brake protein [Oscillospiraceae bacterium]|jgi:c-di-GMP-binding flagellar brake protein YcgR|nr:flagellar brake protein [Oscillospiraceae bacterium]
MVKSALIVGDKVDLHFQSSSFYRSFVENTDADGAILYVSAPMRDGQPVPMAQGREMDVYFYRENGKFSVLTQVIEMRKNKKTGQLTVLLEVMSDTRKEQRREFYRLSAALDIEARYLPHELIKTMPVAFDRLQNPSDYDSAVLEFFNAAQSEQNILSRDISIAGLSLRTSKRYNPGDLIAMKIHIRWPRGANKPILAVGDVRRVQFHPDSKKFFTGVAFYGAFSQRELITKYVYEQQKIRIQQKRLVEGQ